MDRVALDFLGADGKTSDAATVTPNGITDSRTKNIGYTVSPDAGIQV